MTSPCPSTPGECRALVLANRRRAMALIDIGQSALALELIAEAERLSRLADELETQSRRAA